jgi:hypothetical protein
VLVQIDEAWGDDEAPRIDRASSTKRFGGNSHDRVTANPNVANGVQVGLRIDNAAGLQHDVERRWSASAPCHPE